MKVVFSRFYLKNVRDASLSNTLLRGHSCKHTPTHETLNSGGQTGT